VFCKRKILYDKGITKLKFFSLLTSNMPHNKMCYYSIIGLNFNAAMKLE